MRARALLSAAKTAKVEQHEKAKDDMVEIFVFFPLGDTSAVRKAVAPTRGQVLAKQMKVKMQDSTIVCPTRLARGMQRKRRLPISTARNVNPPAHSFDSTWVCSTPSTFHEVRKSFVLIITSEVVGVTFEAQAR